MEKEEKQLTAAEELKALEEKRAKLKKKVAQERADRKKNGAELRKTRDLEIDRIRGILNTVQAEIFAYNKLGKAAKAEIPILEKIKDLAFQNIDEPAAEEPVDEPDENETGVDGTEA